jgi:hypothetical protein
MFQTVHFENILYVVLSNHFIWRYKNYGTKKEKLLKIKIQTKKNY